MQRRHIDERRISRSAVAHRTPGAAWAATVLSVAACCCAAGLWSGRLEAADAASTASYANSWDQYQALLKQARGGSHKTARTLPDWTGLWIRDSNHIGASFDDSAGPIPALKDYGVGRNTAPLTPRYEAAYEQKVADIAAGKEWDRLSYCLPAGFPRWLAEPFLREFILTPPEIWMTHEQINETRRIYMDGRGHVPDEEAIPLWMGDSIGFWAGDTLVIHTNHMKAGEYARGQPDYSFAISTVEQIRKTSASTLNDEITVYDPIGLTRPWHVVLHYKKVTEPDVRINYNACEENNNVYRGADGSTQYLVPGDKNYRDPNTFGIPEVTWDSRPK